MVEEVEENIGRLLEARGHQKSLKKVEVGNQVGNHSVGVVTCFPLLRLSLFPSKRSRRQISLHSDDVCAKGLSLY